MKQAMRLATGDKSKAIARKIRFTVATLELLNPPAGKDRVWAYDEKTPGLAFMATNAGSKAFYLYKKINGRPKRIRIGGFPEISIEQARGMAAKLNGEIAGGADPHEDRKLLRASSTLKELWERYHAEYAKVRLRPATIVSEKSRYDTCLAVWGSRTLASIKPTDVRALHASLGKSRGKTSANRALQFLRRLFNFARFKPNPVSGEVSFFSETSRERFLQPSETTQFFKSLDEYGVESNRIYGKTIRDFIYMSLWSGARSGNVKSMRWADVDMEQGLWKIPSDQSKSKKPMTIHLCTEAVDILTRRATSKSEWVFPARTGDGHLIDAKKGWEQICVNANIEDFHLHDLRRTLGSWMVSAGASLPAIGKQLGHSNVATTQIYSRMNLDSTKPFVNLAVAALVKSGTPKVAE